MSANNKWMTQYADAGPADESPFKEIRQLQIPGRVWHGIEVLDLKYHLPINEYKDMIAGGGHRFSGVLVEIDLDLVDVVEALRSCSMDTEPEITDLVRAWCCFDYGAYAPMKTIEGAREKLVRTGLRQFSDQLEADPELRERTLETTVNRLGSTAREYAVGNFQGTVERRLLELMEHPERELDQEFLISAKMHGTKLVVNSRPEDWLPYVMGYMDGAAGHRKAQPESDDPGDAIAPEYYQGYRLGELVQAGVASIPNWIQTCKNG